MSGSPTRIPVDAKNPIAFNGAEAAQFVPHVVTLVQALQDTRLLRVIQLIESESPRTVQELAAKIHLSSSYLQHLFKRQVGFCITRLLTEQRLLKAAQLLAESDMSIKEVAYAAGYEHASSFIRAFQQRFNQTPRAYRLHARFPNTSGQVNFSSFGS